MRTARRLAAAALSLVTLSGLLVGVPLALVVFVGWPLLHSWPSMTQVRNVLETSGISDTLLIDVLALVCWVAWLDFAIATIVECAATVSGRPARRVPVVRAWQPVVARLITTIVLAWSAVGARPGPAAPVHGATLAVALAGRHAPSGDGTLAVAVRTQDAANVAAQPAPTRADDYVVRRGDTLWDIAHRRLGDARRWTEIWRRNEGRPEPGGRHLTDPNLIVTGWRLEVPAPSGAAPQTAPQPKAPPPGPTPPEHAQPTPLGSPIPPSAPAEPETRVAPPSGQPRPQQVPAPSSTRGGVQLPQGGLVGLGFAAGVLSSLAAARVHERRHRRIGQTPAGSAESLIGPSVLQLQRASRAEQLRTAPRSEHHVDTALARGILRGGQVPGRVCIGLPPGAVESTGPAALDTRTDIVELSGLAFVGAGAEAVLRALIAAMAGSDWREGTEVLLVGDCGGLVAGVTELTGVSLVPDGRTGDREVRGGIQHRLASLRNQGAEDYRALVDSVDPVGAMLAVLDPAALDVAMSTELAGVAQACRRAGVCIVTLGEAPGFERVHVAADGTVLEAPAHIRDLIARFFTLHAEEGREILTVISAGRDHQVLIEEPPPTNDVAESGSADAVAAGDAETTERATRRVRVRLFGRPRVEVDGSEVTTGVRDTARELLCLLAMRPSGLRLDEGCTEMWPDDEDSHVDIFRVSVTSTRRVLRDLTGLADARFIVHDTDRYSLERTVVDADVWQLDRAVAAVARAADDAERRAALEPVEAILDGEPLAGAAYEWAEPVRVNLRRRALDALAELARLRAAAGDDAAALAALERARSVDPYCEDVYRRLMRQLDAAGRVDMAKRVYTELELLTSDLGEFPEQETEDLMVEMESREYAKQERGRRTTAFAARRTTAGNGRVHGSPARPPRPSQPGLPILDEDVSRPS